MSHEHDHDHGPACAHQAKIEEISPVKRKLTVTVPAEAVSREYEEMLKRVGKAASIKGFRQGKVPRPMLEKYFGPEIEKETLENLLKHSLGHSFDELKLAPVGPPEVSDLHFKRGEEFRYQATFEVKPAIQLAPYKGLELKRPSSEIGDKEVEEQLQRLRDLQATLKPRLAGAEITKGDYVTLDLDGRVNGAAHPKLKAEGQVLIAGEGMIYPEIDSALIGKKEGDTFSCQITLPGDLKEAELSGQKAEISALVRTIKQKVLPELSDEFAANLGGEAKTLSELKERLHQDLLRQAQRAAEEKLRDQVLKKLAAANPFPLPEALVEKEMHYLMERTLQRMRLNGMKVEAEAFRDPETQSKFRQGAEENIRRELLLEKIAEQENLAIGDEELQAELGRLAKDSGMPAEEVYKLYRNEESREELRYKMRHQKTLDFILGQAKIS